MQSHGGPQLVAELPQSLKNATASKYFGLSNVRYGSLADIGQPIRDVRFIPRSRHAHRRSALGHLADSLTSPRLVHSQGFGRKEVLKSKMVEGREKPSD